METMIKKGCGWAASTAKDTCLSAKYRSLVGLRGGSEH